jgi:hypothetical protein
MLLPLSAFFPMAHVLHRRVPESIPRRDLLLLVPYNFRRNRPERPAKGNATAMLEPTRQQLDVD